MRRATTVQHIRHKTMTVNWRHAWLEMTHERRVTITLNRLSPQKHTSSRSSTIAAPSRTWNTRTKNTSAANAATTGTRYVRTTSATARSSRRRVPLYQLLLGHFTHRLSLPTASRQLEESQKNPVTARKKAPSTSRSQNLCLKEKWSLERNYRTNREWDKTAEGMMLNFCRKRTSYISCLQCPGTVYMTHLPRTTLSHAQMVRGLLRSHFGSRLKRIFVSQIKTVHTRRAMSYTLKTLTPRTGTPSSPFPEPVFQHQACQGPRP